MTFMVSTRNVIAPSDDERLLPAKEDTQRPAHNREDHDSRSSPGVFCCRAAPATMMSIKIARVAAGFFWTKRDDCARSATDDVAVK
jgi:hypothetical protein